MYKAVIARIHTRELPGADNLVLGTVLGYQVIVSKDTEDGQLGVFFEAGGQLDEEFAKVHDLVQRKDENGNRAGGFFEPNRRVKAIRLRSARSEGFWCPLDHLAYTGYDVSQLKEGDQFEELNGHTICRKYFTPATLRQGRSAKNNRGETPMFPKHVDYEAFKRGAGLIPKGAVVYITEKLHGTSFRYGHVQDQVPVKLHPVERFFRKLLRKGPKLQNQWVHVNGSRNVILERCDPNELRFYGKEDFRYHATANIRLRKGEVIYGELVGYTDTGQPIMAPQNTDVLKDKALQQKFGKEIVYRYGCIPHQYDLWVYRITLANEDGQAVELSWPQVVQRCKELGLKPVPQVTDPATGQPMTPFIYDGDVTRLTELVTRVTGDDGQASEVDPSHIKEGVVVRHESEFGIGWLKNKSFTFFVLEGVLRENEAFVDAEEAA